MAIGRGDASIGPSWAPCEVSAELSIVGATSGGSDVGGGASQSRQVWSQARLAARTVLRVIQGGRLITCCAATQGDVLRAQRRVSGEGAALIWVGVAGECPAWQRSALASCGNVVWEKSEALGILDRGTRSGPAAEALQGAQGADVVKRRRRQGDDDPGRQDRRSYGMEDMRWQVLTTVGGCRGMSPFWCNDRQAQHLDQDCAGRGSQHREICSLHTCRDVQRGQML